MASYPLTIVDNFFDDPDKIRNLALRMSYTPDERGTYPAVRSEQLYINNKPLFDLVCRKILSIYYDLHSNQSINWNVNMSFQKVNKSYGSGWIHIDSPALLSAIVYLNPNASPDSGTSMYRLKKDVVAADDQYNVIKEDFYLGKTSFEEAEKSRIKSNGQFDEVVKINNSYNRLIVFDATTPHGALNFFGNNDEDTRLTLAIFFHKLNVDKTPYIRMKSHL